MTPWIQETRNGFEIAEEEIDRLEALPFQGEQSYMVQVDMKKWAQKEGMWPHSNYRNIIGSHASARGWTQEGFTGMEIVDETV
tara:strand:- start:281 stop:529 length:249 start_codon:yes stop_codon:yes gene_type:complete